MAFPKIWSRFAIVVLSNDRLDIDAADSPNALATIAAGTDYYPSSHTGTAQSFVDALKTAIEAADVGANTYVVAISATGILSITGSTVEFQIDFKTATYGTALRDLMGGTTDVYASTARVVTLPNVIQYAWYPNQPGRANETGPRLRGSGASGLSEGAQYYGGGGPQTREWRQWEHQRISFALAKTPSRDTPSDKSWGWHDLWNYHRRTGERFRFFEDRAGDHSTYEAVYNLDFDHYQVGDNELDSLEEPMVPKLRTFWRIPIRVFRAYDASSVPLP